MAGGVNAGAGPGFGADDRSGACANPGAASARATSVARVTRCLRNMGKPASVVLSVVLSVILPVAFPWSFSEWHHDQLPPPIGWQPPPDGLLQIGDRPRPVARQVLIEEVRVAGLRVVGVQ